VIPFPQDASMATSRIALADGRSDGADGAPAQWRASIPTPERHRGEIGSATGVSNGADCGLYAPLANAGRRRQALRRCRYADAHGQVSVATHEDATLAIPTRFSLGYMKSMDNRRLENADNLLRHPVRSRLRPCRCRWLARFADPAAK